MKNHAVCLFLLIGLSVLTSCGEGPSSSENEQPEKLFSPAAWLAKDTMGIFRGAEFGDASEVIRQMENDTFLVAAEPRLLQYDYPLPGNRHFELRFDFRKNRLVSFAFDAFLGEEKEGETLTEDFIRYFTSRFGDCESQMGILVWPVPAPAEYKEAFLELEDESAEYGYGKVNVSVYAISR
jgi:hypothetical protein